MRPLKDQLLHLLEQYPIEVENVLYLGPNRYRIDGPFAMYEAKVVSHTSGLLQEFIANYAAKHGFWKSQRFILNVYHEPFVELSDQQLFYVTDWFAGSPCSVDHDGVKVAVTVANLHSALEGSVEALRAAGHSKIVPKPRNFISELIQDERMLEKTWLKVNSAQSNPASWSKWLEEGTERAKWVIRVLREMSSAPGGFVQRESQLCFGGVSFEHFIRFGNGRIGVLQTEDPRRGEPLLDLAILANRACAAGSANRVEEMLTAYTKRRYLIPLQADFVRVFAAFPTHLVDIVKKGLLQTPNKEKGVNVGLELERAARAAHQLLRLIKHTD